MKTKILVGIGVLFVFGLGVAAGGLGSALWFGARLREVVEGDSRVVEKIIVRKAAGQLKMTEEQRDRFRNLVGEAGIEIRPIQEKAGAEVRALLREEYAPRVRGILDANQVKAFDRWLESLPEKDGKGT